MKKFLAVAVVVLLAVPAFAANPIAKGNFVVSLPLLTYASQSGDAEETTWIFGIGAYEIGVEWFLIDGLTIGGAFSYETQKETDTTVTTVMPMIKYYFAMGQIIPYAAVGVEYVKSDNAGSEATTTTYQLGVGAAYMLGNNLALFGELGYGMSSIENGVTVDFNTLAFNAGIKAFF